MSSKQLQDSVNDILGLKSVDEASDELKESNGINKISDLSRRLYNSSLNKVMLKNDEEIARPYLCAFLACQLFEEKRKLTNLLYFIDRIPLEPRKAKNLIQLFKYQLVDNASPLKNYNWSPSPKKNKKQNSPLKSTESLVSRNPEELRKDLFGSPSASRILKTPSASPLKDTLALTAKSAQASPLKTRRRLEFEEENLEDINEFVSSISSPVKNKKKDSDISPSREPTPVEISETSVILESPTKRRGRPRKTDIREGNQIPKSPEKKRISLLEKKHAKVSISEFFKLCNLFELPKDVTYPIYDFFQKNSSFLISPWQLVCGLILISSFIAHSKKCRKDPRTKLLIIQKMLIPMRTRSVQDITATIPIVKELITAETWYRNMQMRYNCFDGISFNEVSSQKLGSMLQKDNVLFTSNQYAIWEQRILQDISLRQGK